MLLLGLGLIAAGVLLMVAEVFIPSGGILAILAGVTSLVGVVILFYEDTTWGLIGVLGVLVLGPVGISFALKVWPNTPIGRRMLLGDLTEEEIALQKLAEKEERDRWRALVGAEGIVMTPLRPVGVVRIGDVRYDALAETGLIESGARVRVTAVQDNQIKVRAI
jgi:membrane-bound ClpP family serine protease